MDRGASERDRRGEAERAPGSSKRGAIAAFAGEETARRRYQRSKAEIAPRVAATAAKQEKREAIATFYRAGGAEVMALQGAHEATPPFHDDWTIVKGSSCDAGKWELEIRLRDSRNKLIREHLHEGRIVCYQSSGNPMWPLVQSNDA